MQFESAAPGSHSSGQPLSTKNRRNRTVTLKSVQFAESRSFYRGVVMEVVNATGNRSKTLKTVSLSSKADSPIGPFSRPLLWRSGVSAASVR